MAATTSESGYWLGGYWLVGYWLASAIASHWPIGQVTSGSEGATASGTARSIKDVAARPLMGGLNEPGSSSIVFGP